jgi:hypothetical protein
MNLALVAIVLAIGAGAVVAVSTRERGAAAIGLAVALVASALLADPLPSAAVMGVRIVAALLAASLIRWAARTGPRQPSPLGWPAEALLATAGAVAGLGLAVGLASVAAALGGVQVGEPGAAGGLGTGVGASGAEAALLTAMALTIAAGTSLLILGGAPLVHGQPGIRRAIGLVLVTQAVLLIRLGVAGPAVELEEVARAALLVAAAASGAALARATAAAARADRVEGASSVGGGAAADREADPGTPAKPEVREGRRSGATR